MAVKASLTNPLQPSTSTFNCGQSNTFTVAGTDFTSSNIGSVNCSTSDNTISWAVNSYSVLSGTSLQIVATPTYTPSMLDDTIADLTVTINQGTPNQSQATKTQISYKTN